MSCLREYSRWTRGNRAVGWFYSRASGCYRVLSAVVPERSRSALLTICWMVSCDYSPCRQKKEGQISSPVVSDLHTLSTSSAQLTSVWDPLQSNMCSSCRQYWWTFLKATRQKNILCRERVCCDLLWISHFFSLCILPVLFVTLCCNLTLIYLFTYIIQNARDIIWLAHYIILCKCLRQQNSIWMLFNID